ncbi:MAG: PSD1 and planctomycete cytochrome C domain-containing protein, partial [Opitutaceae bacterium]
MRAPLLFSLLFAAATGLRAALPPEHVEFFEAKVRPLLAEHCYKCHSAAQGKSKGGLQLDTRDALRRGGASGAAIVAGDTTKGLLLEAVRYKNDDLLMPPPDEGGRLSPEKVAVLEEWVRMGAPDPRDGGPASPLDMDAARRHWALQPVRKPAVPSSGDPRISPIDALVRATQTERGLAAAPEADARTLLRRVTYGLTGLPPTPREAEDFARDYPLDPSAYERVVDRLLASPAYGERWGRFWLDVARYADTKGYLAGNEERRYAFSHTYRDYVIRAFNADLPYDRFIVEQLAADRLPLGEDKSPLAALGFLTLGRRFLNNQNDIIDDRIDVVTRGLLGLTVTCARCHDHKFDPVSMQDYYGLHGVFASSEEPAEKPLLGPLVDSPAHQDFLRKREEAAERIRERERSEVAKFVEGLKAKTGDYLLAAHDAEQLPADAKFDLFAGTRKVNPEVLRRWQAFLRTEPARSHPLLAPWFALTALPAEGFAAAAADLLASWRTSPPPGMDGTLVSWFAARENPPVALADFAGLFNDLFNTAFPSTEKNAKSGKAKAPPPVRIEVSPALVAAAQAWAAAEGFPANLSFDAASVLIRRQLNERTAQLRRELESLNWTEPGAPLRAMALVDRDKPRDSAVFLRGNPANRGPEAPRRFLEVLGGPERPRFGDGSGRLELAKAIADPANPLTARVLVNRVWGWHFGQALVRTPSDFGVRTDPPEQRALLDWLAADFTAGGWSVKRLHRAIVLSRTYRQSGAVSAVTLAADPENRYLTRFSRRRLEFEALRDTLLVAAGRLDPQVGGLPVDLLAEPFPGRRTVYGVIDRQNLPGMFRTFDLPNPDVSSAQRFPTTVPQQALFLLNSPFALEMARAAAARATPAAAGASGAEIEALFRLVHQRRPDAEE